MRQSVVSPTLILSLLLLSGPVLAESGWDRAVASFGSADYERAATELEGVLEKHPNYAPAHAFLGVVYHRMGEATRAIPNYEKALELAPAEETTRLSLSRALVEVERYGRASEALESVDLERLDSEQSLQCAQLIAVVANRGHGTQGLGLQVEELLLRLPDEPDLWSAAGRLRADQRDAQGSLSAYERALTLDDTEARRNLLLTTGVHQAWSAESDTEKQALYLRVAKNSLAWTDLSPQTALLAAEAWIGARRCAEAGPFLDLARAGATVLRASFYSGQCAALRGETAQAIRDFEAALQVGHLEPGLEPRIQKALANAYHAAHRYAEAARVFRESGDTEGADRMVEAARIAKVNAELDRQAEECREQRRSFDEDLAQKAGELGPEDLERLRRSYAAKAASCEAAP